MVKIWLINYLTKDERNSRYILNFYFQIQLPAYIENVRDRLAENLHEVWAASKIEQGWSFGEVSFYFINVYFKLYLFIVCQQK